MNNNENLYRIITQFSIKTGYNFNFQVLKIYELHFKEIGHLPFIEKIQQDFFFSNIALQLIEMTAVITIYTLLPDF